MRLSYITLAELSDMGDVQAKQAADAWMGLYLTSCRTTGVLVCIWWDRRTDRFNIATARPGVKPWERQNSNCCMI